MYGMLRKGILHRGVRARWHGVTAATDFERGEEAERGARDAACVG